MGAFPISFVEWLSLTYKNKFTFDCKGTIRSTTKMHTPDLMIATDRNILEPAKWVDNHADYLYYYALSRINNTELARDLVQDVFLAGLEKTGSFEGRSTERTWLTSILRNKIVDIYRKKTAGSLEIATREKFEPDPGDFFEANGHWKDKHLPLPMWEDDADVVQSKEFEKILAGCMKKLPAMWMSVFTMKHFEEEPTKTICQVLDITPSNYWIIIHRAKLNLRACLQKNWI